MQTCWENTLIVWDNVYRKENIREISKSRLKEYRGGGKKTNIEDQCLSKREFKRETEGKNENWRLMLFW